MATPVSADIDWITFDRGLLHELGDPDTPQNEDALLGWQKAEQEPESPFAAWNPFNTHRVAYGSHNTGSALEQSYPGPTEGIKATAATIRQGNFAGIAAALKAGTSSEAVLHAVQSSAWASGRYGSSGDLAGILPTIRSNRSRFEHGKIAATSSTTGGSHLDNGSIVGQAQALAGNAAAGVSSAASDAASSLVSSIGTGLQKLVIMGVLIAGGVGLLVAGAYRGVSPETREKLKGAAVKSAEVAAA